MALKVPLSYSPIDPVAIKKLLDQYADRPHEEMITDFESRLSEFTKSRYVVALNSGTAAIHLALKAVGVLPGDEVLVSTFTYVATVNPILYLGAKPVFIDVEAQSWNMDPDLLELAIQNCLKRGKAPKAILVVHTYGMPAKMEEIMRLSGQYGIPVVEDAAEALGSKLGSKSVGTFGKVGILSFNNNKILTTYGGGAVLTNDYEVAQRIMFWAGQSRESKLFYEHKELGYNYRMGPINAAVGLSKIGQLDTEISQRRASFEKYRMLLSGCGCQWQEERSECFSNRWLSSTLVNRNMDLNSILETLDNEGIETRRVWNPMHNQPLYTPFDYFTKGNISDILFREAICLPFCWGAEKVVATQLIKMAVEQKK